MSMTGAAHAVGGTLYQARLQAAARWRAARGPAGVFGWVTFVFALLVFNAAARAGDTVRALADGTDSTANVYADSWVRSWASGSLIDSLGGAILGVFALAVFTPALTPTDQGFIPGEHSAGWPTRTMTRYVGSLYTQLVSLACALGLFLVTGAASMLTLDGQGRAGALVLVWGVWVAGLLTGPLVMWTRELVHRAGWTRPATVMVATATAGGVAAVATHPGARTHLLYVGSTIVRLSSASPWGTFAVSAAVALVLVWAGYRVCQAALALPAPAVTPRSTRTRPLSSDLNKAYWQATVRTVLRTRSLVQQFVGVAGVGAALAFTVHGTAASAAALVVTIPVGTVVAWQVNSLSVLSSAAGWIAARPGLAARTLLMHTRLGACLLGAVTGVSVAVAVAAGRLPWSALPTVLVACVVAGLWALAGSATFAITRPRRADVHDGHPLLPAVTTIVYTLVLMLGPGVVGALLTIGPTWWSADSNVTVTLARTWVLALILAVVGGAWLFTLHRVWGRTPTLRAAALLAVTN